MRIVLILTAALLITVSYTFAEKDGNEVKVKGKINVMSEIKGKAIVSFFSKNKGPAPNLEYYVRIPDFVIESDKNYEFHGNVLKGEYYVGISFNEEGKKGPVKKGDYYFILNESFVFNDKNDYDLGEIFVKPVRLDEFKVKTAVEGVVLDENNKPVKGAYVFGFLKGAKSKKPLYVSEPTDSNGQFLLRLGSGGQYYLKVRENVNAGTPIQNSIVGVYGGNEAKEVNVEEGVVVTKIVIKAEKIGKSENSKQEN